MQSFPPHTYTHTNTYRERKRTPVGSSEIGKQRFMNNRNNGNHMRDILMISQVELCAISFSLSLSAWNHCLSSFVRSFGEWNGKQSFYCEGMLKATHNGTAFVSMTFVIVEYESCANCAVFFSFIIIFHF